ncbi:MAG: DUF4159 domain-containing protein [Acidobacteria bacterium]|nr:DUF4159 domain-containing protein [Acidobacteriota bacterium]
MSVGSRVRLACLALGLLAAASTAHAQFGRRVLLSSFVATPERFDGGFQFCRVVFSSAFRGDGGSWNVDFPRADINLSLRLSELTHTPVSMDPGEEPKHLLVRLTDDMLFHCPFVMMTEVGSARITPVEAERLRQYLEKGGFLWADDFWGSYAWEYWLTQLRQALPAAEFPQVDLEADHALFQSQFVVERVPQIPSINFWAGTGSTSERGADSAVARARAITDRDGRVLVLMTHNTDIGDSWEREADDPRYFYEFGPKGYAFGINTVLYALTH